MPNYLVSLSDDAVVLRNYEGMLDPLPGRGQAAARSSRPPTRGVSGLLQGDKTALIPEGNERMARRQAERRDAGDAAGAATAKAAESTGDRPAAASCRCRSLNGRQRARARRAADRSEQPRHGPAGGVRPPRSFRGGRRMHIGIAFDLKPDGPLPPAPRTTCHEEFDCPGHRRGHRATCSASLGHTVRRTRRRPAAPRSRPAEPARPRVQLRRGHGRLAGRARPACRPCARCSASRTPGPTRSRWPSPSTRT